MGAYAALQFGLRYPQAASALVIAGVGTGSPLLIREQWRAQSEALGRDFLKVAAWMRSLKKPATARHASSC